MSVMLLYYIQNKRDSSHTNMQNANTTATIFSKQFFGIFYLKALKTMIHKGS